MFVTWLYYIIVVFLTLRILIFIVLEYYCKALWTINGRWRYIDAYLFIYLFILAWSGLLSTTAN